MQANKRDVKKYRSMRMKVVLSIAGSDSGGGAGIQADIKSAQYHGVFMTTAITAVTAQNTKGVSGVCVLEPSFVKEQINSVLSDFKVASIKIGMLGSKKLVLEIDSSGIVGSVGSTQICLAGSKVLLITPALNPKESNPPSQRSILYAYANFAFKVLFAIPSSSYDKDKPNPDCILSQ